MRILLAGHTVPQSGVWGMSIGFSRYIYNLGKSLKELNNDVKLLIRDDFSPSEPWIETVHAPKFSWIPYPLYLSKKIKNLEADVYHSDYVTTGAPFIWNDKTPSVVAIHDVIPFHYALKNMKLRDLVITAWYRYCFRTIRKADALLVFSNSAKEEAVKLGIEREKLKVVYHGCDTSIFHPLPKTKSDIVKIGYLGGLDGRKNVILLVQAFEKLRKEYGNKVELHVGGGGKNLEAFRKLGVDGTHFYGFVDNKDVTKFYNSLDIFVFPSLSEGFGNMIAEAMHCGLPVVACNASTSPELIQKYGVIVEPNIESMAAGLRPLIEDEHMRQKYSKLSLERAKVFTYENHANGMMAIYKSLLGG
ncbi:MAG: glycosyltransferase family 4 protein [Candidatus Aenigmarchaeota archaeon]|nr:glycosyltransferase family 4 protein [Candidatus Aenigmarchaeota archaeon]